MPASGEILMYSGVKTEYEHRGTVLRRLLLVPQQPISTGEGEGQWTFAYPTMSTVVVVLYQNSRIQESLAPKAATAENPFARAIRRLGEVSGLESKRLAEIFGVSRQAFHGWLTGVAKPRAKNLDHVLEVLALLEAAGGQLAGRSLDEWLLTPVYEKTGRRPIDLLRDRKADAFRGLISRASTSFEPVQLPPDRLEAARRRAAAPLVFEDE